MFDVDAPRSAYDVIEDEAIPAAAAVRTFSDCALYTASSFMGNIERLDCRLVTITEGVEYAQYKNAVKVEYMEKGKRRSRSFLLTYDPFLVILSAKDAVEPDSMLGAKTPCNAGVMLLQSRYSSFDKRWRSDFLAVLQAKDIQPIFQVGSDYDTGGDH